MDTAAIERSFILHWGEMASSWGINRATAQVHALLLVSARPLDARTICERLSIARSNVSTSLRDLQQWGIVKTVHILGDRRDHFEAEKDIWKTLAVIADRRIEREILPTLELLKRLQQETPKRSGQLARMLSEFTTIFESGLGFYRTLRTLPVSAVKRILSFDRGMRALLPGKRGRHG